MRYRYPAIPALVALLTACVTVNVYFPAAAAEQAADKIIDRVTGQAGPSAAPGNDRGTTGAPGTPGTPGASDAPGAASPSATPAQPAPRAQPDAAPPPQARAALSSARAVRRAAAPAPLAARAERLLLTALSSVIEHTIPAAHAQGSANLDISTPQIRAITDSMQRRFPQLAPFFASGAIGMTADGLVSVRDPNAVPLAQRALVTRLVADDNRDRTALYAEIARANGHPEWEPDIRRTFARRWVERGAQPGWYYQDASGAWKQR
jgi:uncharacterized protein